MRRVGMFPGVFALALITLVDVASNAALSHQDEFQNRARGPHSGPHYYDLYDHNGAILNNNVLHEQPFNNDLDNDGVPDKDDYCLHSSPNAHVNAGGCEHDFDFDRVPDYADSCLNTRPRVPVDIRGCERHNAGDSDGDGVLDSRDQCPSTLPEMPVDSNGCATQSTVVLPRVQFELDSDKLLLGSLSVLDRAVQSLRNRPDLVVEVAGHTDSQGSEAYNRDLSNRRAASVKRYLISQNVSPRQLQARGYGELRPIATNRTPAGRARNRRVELRVLSQGPRPTAVFERRRR